MIKFSDTGGSVRYGKQRQPAECMSPTGDSGYSGLSPGGSAGPVLPSSQIIQENTEIQTFMSSILDLKYWQLI